MQKKKKREKKKQKPPFLSPPPHKPQPIARWQIKVWTKQGKLCVKRNQLNKSEFCTLKEVVQFNKILCQIHSRVSGYPVWMLGLQLLCSTLPCANDSSCFLSSSFLLFCGLERSRTPALPAPKVFAPKIEHKSIRADSASRGWEGGKRSKRTCSRLCSRAVLPSPAAMSTDRADLALWQSPVVGCDVGIWSFTPRWVSRYTELPVSTTFPSPRSGLNRCVFLCGWYGQTFSVCCNSDAVYGWEIYSTSNVLSVLAGGVLREPPLRWHSCQLQHSHRVVYGIATRCGEEAECAPGWWWAPGTALCCSGCILAVSASLI